MIMTSLYNEKITSITTATKKKERIYRNKIMMRNEIMKEIDEAIIARR